MADGPSSICNILLFFLFLNCLGLTTEIEGQELAAKDFKVIKPWADTIADDLVKDVSKYSSFDTIKNAYIKETKNPPKDKLEWKDINGTQLLATMQSDLEVLLTGKMQALKKSVETAKELELNFDYEQVKLHPEEYERVDYFSMKPPVADDEEWEDAYLNATMDPAVGRKVILDRSAVHIPVEVYDKEPAVLEAINWTAGLEDVWMENRAEDPKLAWQYFGSSTGFMRTYPAAAWTFPMGDVDLYDCRRRPWYTQGSSSPKDMLILVDTSGSSHGQALELMKIATKTMIDTLGEDDFVLLAHFPVKIEDDNVTEEYPSEETVCKKPYEYVKHQATKGASTADHSNTYEVSCFNTFVQANNRNKKILFDAVDNLKAHGMANFGEAFCWAFDQFEKFRKIRHIGSNCTEMIMVLTDGSTQYPEEVFKTRNPDKQVRVFTYAVGVAATATATVKKMACENKGYFSPIPAMGAINTKVQEYEPVISRPFAMAQSEQLHWTSSYVDAPQVGTGMVITATIPVFKKPRRIDIDLNGVETFEANSSHILGVMGLDIRTEELQDIQPSQTLGPSGYSFAINNNGLVIFHPRLRTEMGYLKDPPNVDLLDVEYETPEMEMIRNEMVDGKKGKKEIVTCAKSMDDKHIECGKRVYYYAPIPGTPLSLGISIPNSAKTVLLVKGIKPKQVLKDFEEDIAHSGESRIIIAPWDYCGSVADATGDAEDDIIKAIRDLNCTSSRVQHLLFDAEITRAVTKLWGEEKQGIINSFVSTVGGVTRIFPQEDESMDELTNTWKEVYFRRAIDTPASWIFIPEEGPKGNESEPHIKVAKAVVLDNQYRPAVAGIHVSHTYMRDLMVKHTANEELNCGEPDQTLCFLLDEGAFIVTTNQDVEKTGLFFGKIEPHIMNYMVENGVYKKYEEYDFQGTCKVDRKYNNAGPRGFWVPSFIPYDALTLTWWTSRAAAAWAQFNVATWIHSLIGSFNGVSATEEEDLHQACILKQAQYDFGHVLETDKQKQQSTTADVTICNCTRSFGASLISGTNLLLVVAESDAGCEDSECQPEELPLQEPQEDSGPSLGDRICEQQSKPRHRNLLKGQCISKHPAEEKMNFPCGSAFGLSPSFLVTSSSLVLALASSWIC